MYLLRRFSGLQGPDLVGEGVQRGSQGVAEEDVSEFFRCVEVTLREDLSLYHPSLRPGVKGTTAVPVGPDAGDDERYCRVRFPKVEVDVLWSGLDVTDAAWLAEAARGEADREAAIRTTAKEGVAYLGQRGGFRKLVVQYVDQAGVTRAWVARGKSERKKCEALLGRLGIAIREVTER